MVFKLENVVVSFFGEAYICKDRKFDARTKYLLIEYNNLNHIALKNG
jgi:hypothetical protein